MNNELKATAFDTLVEILGLKLNVRQNGNIDIPNLRLENVDNIGIDIEDTDFEILKNVMEAYEEE